MFPIQNAIPTRYPPVVTWYLIAANCAVFFIEINLSPPELEWLLARFALIPARYFAPPPYGDVSLTAWDYLPFASNMFLHGGWLHLILNMWTLWLFGPAVEDRLGRGRYLLFYLACGILASVTHAVFKAHARSDAHAQDRADRTQAPLASDPAGPPAGDDAPPGL